MCIRDRAWTDLPVREPVVAALGVMASPAGWRRFARRAAGVAGRPVTGAACVENGGADGRAAGVVDRREHDRGGGGVGDAAAGGAGARDAGVGAPAGALGRG